MEANNDLDHPYVYIGRAELILRDQKFTLALEDLNKALNSQKLTNSEKYHATLMKISAKSHFIEIEADDIDVKYLIESSEPRLIKQKI